MLDVPLDFNREKYSERLAKTRRAMDGRGIDTLVVSDPSNMAWLTGFDGWSFYTHQAGSGSSTRTRCGGGACRTATAPSSPFTWMAGSG